MILIGYEHANVCPAAFDDLGKGEVYVKVRAICGRILTAAPVDVVEAFYLAQGDPKEEKLWVSFGGKVDKRLFA
jgi:hypothetical protein